MSRLREFMFESVYLAPAARREHTKIEGVLRALFALYADDPELIPAPAATEPADRVIDYLAGMTDRFAIRAFEELCVPRAFTP
jgi:dGTPase